jgi:ribosomal protein S18 acetylase RimI-like enzyme
MKIERFSQLKNIDRLSKIIFFNFIELQNQPNIEFSIKDIASTLVDESVVGWFLLDNSNKIIGYLIGTIKDIGDGRVVYYISYFYIIQKYRNNGLGTKMLLIALDHATKSNIKFVMLISRINSKAWNMYLKFGFIEDPIIKLNNRDYKTLLYYCF